MIFKDPCEQIGTLKLQKVQICSPVKWAHYNDVKIRGPDQGLGPIPASKKCGSGTDSRVQKIMLWDQSLRLLVL